jgi:hypothetical protein
VSLRTLGAFLLLVAAFALASWIGWWAVPLVALLWGALRPGFPRPILAAALAALLGWAFWLLLDFVGDPAALTRIATRVAAVLQLPAVLLLLLTLLWPALLAWSAAALACRLAGARAPRLPRD